MQNVPCAERFPSPCGDKLKYSDSSVAITKLVFPSPCGDKLKFKLAGLDWTADVSVPLRG